MLNFHLKEINWKLSWYRIIPYQLEKIFVFVIICKIEVGFKLDKNVDLSMILIGVSSWCNG